MARTDQEYQEARQRMVRVDIAARGVAEPAVLQAMGEVPREEFLPEALRSSAYDDAPLPIEAGQTISQPYIVAYMIEALQLTGNERVLEIGTGSGYAAAVLSRCAAEVFTVERIPSLAHAARSRLAALGYDNVTVLVGDGTLGCREHEPYQGIVVTAGAPEVPRALLSQLAPGGRLVIPVGATQHLQNLVRVRREGGHDFRREELCPVRFVPLVGEQGW
jgi:protein-L-isoaspartate(D-aspartate) O-methyltransferase